MFVLWPDGEGTKVAGFGSSEQTSGVVVDVHRCPDEYAADFGGQIPPGCTSANVDLADQQEDVEAAMPFGAGAPEISTGDRVLLFYSPEAPASQQWQFIDFDRSRVMYALIAVFALAVVLLSRGRGLASLASLAVSLALVIWFVLPNLLGGTSPLAVAIVAAAAIMFISLYLGHGFSSMTSAAMVGTLLSLVLTGVIGGAFTAAANFTGFSNEATKYLSAIRGDINYEGLILAGLVIGALGVLDDVTVTQAAAVWELSAADPTASRRSLFTAAMRIGRAHVSAAVNTLVLAYVSSMLPLLLLLSTTSTGFLEGLTGDAVGQEVARGLIGSLGIVAAVPLTTLVAVLVAGARKDRYAHLDD